MDYTPAELSEFPELPKGWRWERSLSYAGYPTLLLRKRKWYGWKTIEWTYVHNSGFGEVEKAYELVKDLDWETAWSLHLGPVK